MVEDYAFPDEFSAGGGAGLWDGSFTNTGGGTDGYDGSAFPNFNFTVGGGGGTGGAGGGPSLSQTLTQIVDSYESRLKGNLASWQMNQISASAAIANGWQLMNAMVSACLAYGSAGQNAAAERDRRINPALLKWDWIRYYIDPITGGNTPLPPVPGGGVNVNNSLTGGNSQMLLIAALAVLVYLATKD